MMLFMHQKLFPIPKVIFDETAAEEYNWNLNYGEHCPDVAGRLYYSCSFLGKDKTSI